MTPQRRAQYLAAGNCGFCGHPRGRFKFLCDDCARKHRERQRGPNTVPREADPAILATPNEGAGDTLARLWEGK